MLPTNPQLLIFTKWSNRTVRQACCDPVLQFGVPLDRAVEPVPDVLDRILDLCGTAFPTGLEITAGTIEIIRSDRVRSDILHPLQSLLDVLGGSVEVLAERFEATEVDRKVRHPNSFAPLRTIPDEEGYQLEATELERRAKEAIKAAEQADSAAKRADAANTPISYDANDPAAAQSR